MGKLIYTLPEYLWVPANAGITMPECNHCGAHVSERFARVFADEHGEIHACISCSANAGIAEVSRERARSA